MSINAAFEIVLSLAAVFWLVALVASFVVEGLAGILLNLRATALERFVGEMVLGDNRLQAVYRRLTQRMAGSATGDPLGLLAHPLVASLRKPRVWSADASTPPSYIPASIFASSLIDRVAALGQAAAFGASGTRALVEALTGPASPLPPAWRRRLGTSCHDVVDAVKLLPLLSALFNALTALAPARARAEIDDLRNAVAKLAIPAEADRARDFVLRLLNATADAIEALENELQGEEFGQPIAYRLEGGALAVLAMRHAGSVLPSDLHLLDALRAVVDHGPLPRNLAAALRPIVTQAAFDVQAVQLGLENWFDATMDRASGWFKRLTTLWLGLAGFLLAAGFNINPLTIATDLARDPVLRASGVEFARAAVAADGGVRFGQEWVFAEAAGARRWVERARALQANPASAEAEVERLVSEIQPLLLRDSGLVGLLPDIGWRPEADGWTTDERRKEFVQRFCRAVGGRADRTRDAVPGAGSAVDANAECDEVKALDLSSPGAAAASFWQMPAWVLYPALGNALLQARAPAGRADDATRPDPLEFLARQVELAVAQARAASEAARGFLERLPSLGWDAYPGAAAGAGPGEIAAQRLWWLKACLGWALMGLMVSFGAPFWFDLMSNLLQRRVTGPKPAHAGE